MTDFDSDAAAIQRLFDMCRGLHPWSSEMFKAVIQRYPDAICVTDNDGFLPLHHACRSIGTFDVIKTLLDEWPQSVEEMSEYGLMPLHSACEGKSPLPVIQLLVEAWPDALQWKDIYRWIPLHMACSFGCTEDVIQYLIESMPMPWRSNTANGATPLHLAVIENQSLPVLQVLVQAWPDAVHAPDNGGWLLLHYACRHACREDVVRFLVQARPESCQVANKQGEVPLHLACSHQSMAVIRFLLDCYPQAIHCRDKKGQLPLHNACVRGDDNAHEFELIEYLIRAQPDSIQIPCWYNFGSDDDDDDDDPDPEDDHIGHDHNGNEVGDMHRRGRNAGSRTNKALRCNALPIDLACTRGRKPSPELVRLLTNHMPPLHFVCTYVSMFWNSGMSVSMDYLMTLFPEDAMQFYHGMLPFHRACRAGATRPFLNWWWKKYPDIVKVTTADTGDTALHCYLSASHAALNGTTTTTTSSRRQMQRYYSALQFLVEKHPDALRSTNQMGMLPFHRAAVQQVPLDVLFYVACQDPEALLRQNSHIALPDHDPLLSPVHKKRKIDDV